MNTIDHKITFPKLFQALLLLVLCWEIPHSANGQNTLLPGDPTFLTDVSEWLATGDAQISHASEGANTPGAIQLEVFSTNGNIGNATLRSTEINIAPALRGTMLFFNYFAKGQNGDKSFRVRFTLLDEESVETQQQSTTLTLPTSFREYSMPVYLPENTHKIQVQFQCGLQTGKYFFDDMSLAPAGVDLEDIQQFDHWQSRQFSPPASQPGPELQSGNADVSVLIHTDEAGALVLPTQFGVNSNFRSGNDLLDRTSLYQSFGAFRFPAGSGSNRYFWDCNIPDDFAIEVGDICGTASQSLSPDNFVTFKNNANGEATVVVNYFYARYGLTTEGTRAARVQQAADYAAALVQYVNVELNAGIRYWEIGNECYGPWETGYDVNGSIVTGKEYGEDLRVFAEAMKAVDPNIWIGAVLSHKDFDWNNQVLPEVQNHADFLIVHHYFEIDDATSAAQSLQEIANDMQEIQIAAAHYTNKPPGYFPVAFTEFNIQGPEATNIINGLFVAEALATVVQQKYTMSTIWVNEWNLDGQHSKGLLAQNDPNQEDYTARPSYTPFYYLDRYFGDKLLEVSLTGNESVRAYASKFSSGETGLLIVNYGATTQRVNIDFSNPSVTADQLYWHTVHANSQQAGDMKFYVNGQTGNTPGGGPTSLGSIPAFTAAYAPNKQLAIPKYSATYLVINTNISTATGSVEQPVKQFLYPNPTTKWVTIDTDGKRWEQKDIKIFREDGKNWSSRIFIEQSSHKQMNIDLTALPVGLYFLQTPNGTKSIIKK